MGRHKKCCNKECKDNRVFIRACDLPATIIRKGFYVLCDDVTWRRVDRAAITITVSDVTLDLQSHSIDLSSQAYVGISIASPSGASLENIVVRNGTIKNTPLTQALATANDVFFPLVATDPSGNPLPIGPSTIYPLTTIPITVAGILASGLEGASFENLQMDQVLYGIVSLLTVGYVSIDSCKFFNFGISFPNATTTPVAYGAAVFLAGLPTAPAVDLRLTNSDLNSQLSKWATVVYSGNGMVWERNTMTANAGPTPSTNPLIQGPCLFVNSTAGVARECESRNSNTLLEIQYTQAFEFIDCTSWQTYHNGIGVLFCEDVVVKGCIVHRAEGALGTPGVATGSGIKVNVSNNVLVQDSVFTGFTIGTTPTDSNGAGIAVAAANTSTIKNNQSTGNNWGIKEIATTTLQGFVFSENLPYSNNYLSNFANANSIANYLLLPPNNAIVVSISANGTTPVAPYVNLQP